MKRDWTKKEDAYLVKHYPNKKTQLIADHLGRTLSGTYGRAKVLGLCKSEKFKNSAASGRRRKGDPGTSTSFKPGNAPFIKGKKITDIYSAEAIKKMKRHQFKKGHQPHNTKADGVISIRQDKNGRKYKWIRISLSNWKMLHVKIWEDKYGPVPDGHMVCFKDGNSMNTKLKNLQLLTNQEHMENTRMKDKTIATYISGRNNPHLRDEVMKRPELIELKKNQILLNLEIKKHDNTKRH